MSEDSKLLMEINAQLRGVAAKLDALEEKMNSQGTRTSAEIVDLRAYVNRELGEVRGEVRHTQKQIDDLTADLHKRQGFRENLKWIIGIIGGIIGILATIFGMRLLQ